MPKTSEVAKETTNQHFFQLAQKVKPIREKADRYKEETGEVYEYTPEEAEIVQSINMEVYEQLKDFLHDFLHKNCYDSFKGHYEDLLSNCLIVVFNRFPYYNGEYALTTFLGRDLKLTVNKYLGAERGLSQYYNEQNVKIQKAIKELRIKGVEPTVMAISEIINKGKNKKISEKTIRSVLDIAASGAVQPLPDNASEQSNEFADSPKEAYIKSENAKLVEDILSRLEPYERIAYKLSCGVVDVETGPHLEGTFLAGSTYKDVGRQPSLIQAVIDAGKEDWIKYHAVMPSRVEEIVQTAKRKINVHPEVMTRVDAMRQIFTEDIATDEEDAIKSAEDLIIADAFL